MKVSIFLLDFSVMEYDFFTEQARLSEECVQWIKRNLTEFKPYFDEFEHASDILERIQHLVNVMANYDSIVQFENNSEELSSNIDELYEISSYFEKISEKIYMFQQQLYYSSQQEAALITLLYNAKTAGGIH